jgi:hypothetical protein
MKIPTSHLIVTTDAVLEIFFLAYWDGSTMGSSMLRQMFLEWG